MEIKGSWSGLVYSSFLHQPSGSVLPCPPPEMMVQWWGWAALLGAEVIILSGAIGLSLPWGLGRRGKKCPNRPGRPSPSPAGGERDVASSCSHFQSPQSILLERLCLHSDSEKHLPPLPKGKGREDPQCSLPQVFNSVFLKVIWTSLLSSACI